MWKLFNQKLQLLAAPVFIVQGTVGWGGGGCEKQGLCHIDLPLPQLVGLGLGGGLDRYTWQRVSDSAPTQFPVQCTALSWQPQVEAVEKECLCLCIFLSLYYVPRQGRGTHRWKDQALQQVAAAAGRGGRTSSGWMCMGPGGAMMRCHCCCCLPLGLCGQLGLHGGQGVQPVPEWGHDVGGSGV